MQVTTAIKRIASLESAMAAVAKTDDPEVLYRFAERMSKTGEAGMKALADAGVPHGGTPKYREALIAVSHLDGQAATLRERGIALQNAKGLYAEIAEGDYVPVFGGSMAGLWGRESHKAADLLGSIKYHVTAGTEYLGPQSGPLRALRSARESLELLTTPKPQA